MNCEQFTDGTENVLIVGLTGQTGAGKTTISQMFADDGFAIINADKVARQVVTPHSTCLNELCECFGNEILLPDGNMNRAKVAEIVFSDACKNEILGSIMYPYILKEILLQIRAYAAEGKTWLLLDAPTLFESHADDFCTLVLSVLAEPSIRIQRIMKRDGLTEEQAKKRMNAQLSEQYFREHSDFVICNNGSQELLCEMTREVIENIREYRSMHNSYSE